jgi:shikimate kinase/3-dehydroquinate synthase
VREAPAALTEALTALDPTAIVVVTDSHVEAARGAALRAALAPFKGRVITAALAPGEEEKNLNSVSMIWDAALGQGVDRRSVVLGFGGGVVGDMAGFAASTLLRGLRFVQAPTTLLAMVDASVGGKTGFDHPAGKNLIGTFHQPNRVVVDLAHLKTLPLRELRAGLAEVVKMAVLEGGPFLEALEAKADVLGGAEVNKKEDGLDALTPFVRASILGKMRLVRDDELESGPRALLNLGHTAAHALESHGQYRKHLHGEAVGIGMVIELQAAERAGLTKAGTSVRVASLLKRLGLPSSVPPEELRAAWHFVGSDKKKSGSTLLWPIVAAAGEPLMERVSLADLERWAVTH